MELRIVVDDRIVNVFRGARRLLSRRRVAWSLAACVLGSAVVAIGAPVVKPHDFRAGDPILAAEMNENFDALVDAVNALVIREDRTIALSADVDGCAGIEATLRELEEARIVSPALVTIELAPGTYDCEGSLDVQHPNGKRLEIVGGGSGPEEVTLTFPAGLDGVVVESGSVLRRLENLTLVGNGGLDGRGVVARRGGTVSSLNSVVVRNFNDGVSAYYGGTIVGTNVLVENNERVGVFVYFGGNISLTNSTAQDNGLDGFRAQGGTMLLEGCTSMGNVEYGFRAIEGGKLSASSATSNRNLDGFYAEAHGALIANQPTATNNSRYGFQALRGGFIRYSGTATISGNGTAATNPALNTPNPTNGAVVNNN